MEQNNGNFTWGNTFVSESDCNFNFNAVLYQNIMLLLSFVFCVSNNF